MEKFTFNDQETFQNALIEWGKKYPDYDFENSGVSVSAIDRDGGFMVRWPDYGLNFAYPVSYEEIFHNYIFDEADLNLLTAVEVAELIRNTGCWVYEQCERLCELADMEREWAEADGESFEAVVEKAAEKLGVEIYR